MATFIQTIRNVGCQNAKSKSFLGCNKAENDTQVLLQQGDGGFGRQRWVLTPHSTNSYVVKISGGHEGKSVLLGSPASAGGGVRLVASPYQAWTFTLISGREFKISVKDGLGLPDPSVRFLEADPATGVVSLKPANPGAFQRWKCVEAGSSPDPPTPPPTPTGVPTMFVGGAFFATQNDLANDPAGWPTVAPHAGYHLHPMGLIDSMNRGQLPTLLSRFGKKSFVYEMDLLAWSDGTNPLQTNTPQIWADVVRQNDPAFQCEFYAPWVAGDRLANLLDDTTNRFIQIRQKMDVSGYPNKGFFFYAPPCPESIMNAYTLLTATKNGGMPYVEYVVRTAGLKGVVIDFPAGLWLSKNFPANFPAGSGDKCRLLAKQAHDVCRRMSIPFVWCFNGSDKGSVVTKALDSIKAAGMTIDVILNDNFSSTTERGTPESDPASVTGQALAALRWYEMA